MKNILFAITALFAAPLILAASTEQKKIVAADNPQAFADLAASIRLEMESGGRFEFISAGDKAQVNADLDKMQASLNKNGPVSGMKIEDKLALFNTQEHVNGLLTHSDSNRLVCERSNPLGSHISQTTCRTYGQIERDRLHTKKELDDAGMKWPTGKRAGWPELPGNSN
jgi:hypothetical protein